MTSVRVPDVDGRSIWAARGCIVGLVAVGEAVIWSGATRGDGAIPTAVGGVLVAVTGFAGLGWRRSPTFSFAASLVSLGAYTTIGFSASPVSLVTLGLLAWLVVIGRPVAASLAVLSASVIALASANFRAPNNTFSGDVASLVIPGLAALAGLVGRSRVHAAELARREQDLEMTQIRMEANEAALAEREALVGRMHDAVGHSITIATLGLEASAQLVFDDPARAQRILESAARAARDAMSGLQEVIDVVARPNEVAVVPDQVPVLSTAGVSTCRVEELSGADLTNSNVDEHLGALKLVVDGYRAAGLVVQLELPVQSAGFEATAAYKCVVSVVDEGLANVARHSQSCEAHVTVAVTAVSVIACVDDSGTGLAADATFGHGLTRLQQRIANLDGMLTLRPRRPGGARLQAIFPIEHESALIDRDIAAGPL